MIYNFINFKRYKSQKLVFVRNVAFCFLTSLIFLSCSQYNNGPVAKGWNNLNAYYNSLLFGEQKLTYVRKTLENEREKNFYEILPIFEKVDSSKLDTLKPYLEEVIRLSSKIVERHSNSKYLDEAYLLLGKARLYKGETFNAIETFKYVNATSENEENKNTAKIWLFRSYLEEGDITNANNLDGLIKKSNLSKANQIDYYLNQAYFHQQKGEDALAALFLDEATDLMPKSEDRARYIFIAGQLYQKVGENKAAQMHFDDVTKNNPSFELEFYSILNSLLIDRNSSEAMNLYNKMLDEYKNRDYKDQIYVRMGALQDKNSNYTSALDYYSKAIKSSISRQVKANAFYRMSKIYLDQFKDFKNSALYLDSTMTFLDPTFSNYVQIKEEMDYLQNFVKYSNIVATEDSLQMLAKLSPEALNDRLTEIATKQLESEGAQETGKATSKQKTDIGQNRSSGQPVFILYDPLKQAESRQAFKAKWGNRQLSDNWRVSSKQSSNFQLQVSKETDKKTNENAEKELEIQKENQVVERVRILKDGIPLTVDELHNSNERLESAMFELGKLYRVSLIDNEKAKEVLNRLLIRFPESKFRPEALYLLSLISPNESKYQTELLEKYPMSTFARMVKSGNLTMTPEVEIRAEKEYIKLYELYESGDYRSTLAGSTISLQNYVGSEVEDKIAYLRIMSLAKTGDKTGLNEALKEFINSYPKSDLLNRVKGMYAE